MERNRKTHFPQSLRYPFFLIGLVILIGGGVGVLRVPGLPVYADVTVGVVGFVFLILSVVFP